MKRGTKYLILVCITALALVFTLIFKPVSQNQSYHHFADDRAFLGIPNFLNVLTNLPFFFIGAYGFLLLNRNIDNVGIKRMYGVLFSAIFLTGLGSAFYHLGPNNNSLIFDRIPMTIVFMAFFSIVITEFIGARFGNGLFIPFLVTGVISILYWHYTELRGEGDLRFYGFIQFYPLIIIPIIIWLFKTPAQDKRVRTFILVFFWYGAAKIFEVMDKEIYGFTRLISGHSLKHLAAVVASFYIVKLFKIKYTPSEGQQPELASR